MGEANEGILAELVRLRAEREPDLPVLTFEHRSLDGGATPDEVRSYAELWVHGNCLARGLIDRGMQRGDRFALLMANHPEFVESLIAASLSGCVAVPIDPRTRGEKLAYLLRHAGCRGVICADPCLGPLREVQARGVHLEWILSVGSGCQGSGLPAEEGGARPLAEVLAQPAATVDLRLSSGRDPLQILYTSGTTGDPKGVVFPNERFGAYALVGRLAGYGPDERPYTGLSLTHGNAQAVTLASSLHMGLRAVFSRRFTKSQLWEVCRTYGCTTFSLLGGMATALYSEPPRPDDADNPVRFVVSAGMPPAIWGAFERRFGVAIFEWYGAVEGGLAFKPIGQGPVGSFGRPVPGLEMKILDERDRECAPGEVGEICSRPADGGRPAVEYFGNPAASRRKTRGGWLRSGDLGHRDAAGWLFFDSRKGGGIRHNGDFIHPGFVEKALAELPEVEDVFVYGVPAASGAPGEKDVVAAVVPAHPSAFRPAEVFAACRSALEPNFVPTYLQVVDEIPKTASEKPQERFLREGFSQAAPNVFTEAR